MQLQRKFGIPLFVIEVGSSNDWEVDLVMDLLKVLQNERVTSELDKVLRKGWQILAAVCDAYKMLKLNPIDLFPAKDIWVTRVPTKLAFYKWEAV